MRTDQETCNCCGHWKLKDEGTCRFCEGNPPKFRDMKGQCPRCSNTEQTPEGYCSYCVWKGDAGIGKQLRQMIKSVNSGHPTSRSNQHGS